VLCCYDVALATALCYWWPCSRWHGYSEVAIAAASAAVYYFDTDNTQWVPVDGGLSVVYIYQNPDATSFRVIGMSQVEANKVVINSQLFKELQYARASETFHNWADSMQMYGLNFSSVEDAINFENVVGACVAKLNEIAASRMCARWLVSSSPSESCSTPISFVCSLAYVRVFNRACTSSSSAARRYLQHAAPTIAHSLAHSLTHSSSQR